MNQQVPLNHRHFKWIEGKKSNHPGVWTGAMARLILVCALLAVFTFLVFWPVRQCDFLNYDDDGYVTANAHVQQGLTREGMSWAFRTIETANWHPLTWLSLMLDAQWFGHNAAAFHWTNLFLHAANTMLLFLVFTQLTGARWRSALVAALFALHPLHVESVAWIAERKDVLSAFFFMLTLLAYARYAHKQSLNSQPSTLNYFFALFFFALGLMSKSMLVTSPFVLLLLDYWPLQRFKIQGSARTIGILILEKIPFFILSAILSVVTFAVQKQGEAVQNLAAFPVSMRVENTFVAYARYLGKTFWPANLAVPYPYPAHWPAAEILFSAGMIIAASWFAFRFAREFPFFLTGWFWFVGMLLPVIGLVQVGVQSLADRYTYLPLVGIFIAVVWGAGEAWMRWNLPKGLGAIAMVLVLIACAMQTRKQINYWQNSEALFRHAIATTENNGEAYEHLGTYYLRATGQRARAMDCYQRAIQIAPARVSARVNLGSVFLLDGNLDAATEQYEQALRLAPDNAEARCDLGYIAAAKGRFDEAIALYYQAIQSKPDFPSAYHNLGLAFAAKGDWVRAIQNYRTAIQLDPKHVSTHDHLGIALAHEGKAGEAMKEFYEAMRLNPNDAEAMRQLQALQK